MYTKENYRSEIEKFITIEGYRASQIGNITYKIYITHIREIDKKLRNHLLDIASMENGPEFEMSEKEFREFLKKL